MARRPSLKPQLNQIRTWVGEGVTDIWIAHQLASTPAEVAAFRRKHGLLRPDEAAAAPAPRARRAAAAKPASTPKAKPATRAAAKPAAAPAAADAPAADGETADGAEPSKRRRRGRRGGRGRGRGRGAIGAALAHDEDALVIRIDAAVLESAAYREHWASVAAGTVTITATGIAIAPATDADDAADADGED